MVAAALLWVLLPLVRPKTADHDSRGERRVSTVVIAVALPLLAVGMYAGLSNWDWQATQAAAAQEGQMEEALVKLRARLQENPNDVTGWLLLGRSYAAFERYPQAIDAYQQAYDRSQGQDVEAVIGLGEALVMSDEKQLSGRAGKLFDEALVVAPNHPKALWYTAVAALQAGDLQRGRDRLQTLLAQNPPAEVRSVLERQIQDLDQQLGKTGEGASPASAIEGKPTAEAGTRTIRVAVTLDPRIKSQLTSPVPLFILARDPAGGPPLAVQQHSSADLPITIELSERDAMMPNRTIASVPRVQVVARLSRSGAPQARSGDLYGQADYEFAAQGSAAGGTLNIIIDQTVP